MLTLSAIGPATFAQVPNVIVVPDAGKVLRDVQQAPAFSGPQTVPLQGVDTKRESIGKDEARAFVRAIVITGNQEIPLTELQPLVAALAGTERTLSELKAGVRRITAYYRERGFIVARAYLPTQDITSGTVMIGIIEGRIASQRISNQSRLNDEQAINYLRSIKAGDIIKSEQIDRNLLLLQDTPGVGGARATLQPGASVGTSELLVELDPAVPYVANVEMDNYGSRYTGTYRFSAGLALNSPLRIGDLLSVRLLTGGANMDYARLAYQFPVGVDGLKLGSAYASTHYKLGEEFTSLGAHGSAGAASVYATYPFVRTQAANVSGTLTWEHKVLLDKTRTPLSRVDKQVQLATLGLAGNCQDTLWGGSITSFDASLSHGNLTMDPTSLTLDSAPVSAHSNGAFTKLSYTIMRVQALSTNDVLALIFAGQQASKNLNSSEKFSLGGANGVRAYPQGEGNGDTGWMANLEWRHSLSEHLQGTVFYDTGSVNVSRNPYAAGDNSRSIAGAGLGLNGQVRKLQWKTSVAWRTNGGPPISEPAAVSHNPRWWTALSLPL